ncbi:vacuolar membrane protein-domain-containing protein, partial [Coemansia spiralis]
CRLVGPFSIFIQALVGTLGFSTLIIKRYFETPRRPWLVWSFDVSKQMISGAIMHMVNLLVSALSGGSAEPGETATNPCSWYVLNLTIDCTLGVLFVALYIRLFEKLAAYLKITDVLESGNYGNPPSWQRWLKQATLFCASMVSMKLTVVTLIRLIPSLVVIGDLVLKPVQLTNSPRFQIIFVMAVWPLMLNIFESWILDQFIK